MEKKEKKIDPANKLTHRFLRELRKNKTEKECDLLVEYAFAHISILMPSSHQLRIYQEKHRLYDRFLPHLATFLPSGGLVIDVGANVGDTMAAMYCANPNLEFVCIEADHSFFEILEQNINRIRINDANVSVTPIKALVGKSVKNVYLEGTGGTKRAVVNEGGTAALSSRPLDRILEVDTGRTIVLLKCDVDGYDYDVIDSGQELIEEHCPVLFFECDFDKDAQKIAYEKTIDQLIKNGYDHWVIFDNFGEVVLRTNSLSDIVQLFDYVWRQNMKRTTRTIYYFDLLATGKKYRNMVDQCIRDYITNV
jgi:FkbM family methyltransferase